MKGIFVNGKDSYLRFGLRILKRSIGSAKKDDHTERVPYSSVTHDFDAVLGKSYGERTLTYELEMLCRNIRQAESKLIAILDWLHWNGRETLRDPLLPNYYFEVREPVVKWSEDHGIYKFSISFPAAPEIKPAGSKQLTSAMITMPDVDQNGIVDGRDAAAITAAYADISAGIDPGLTPAQLKAADANMDGKIDGRDAAIVLAFYADCAAELRENTPEGWAKYLSELKGLDKGVI